MLYAHSLTTLLWVYTPAVLAQLCDLQFDARVPIGFALEDFDDENDLFDSDNVKGQDLIFSDVLELEVGVSSLFAIETTPLTLTISDASIFAPSPDNIQTGFRRAELLPASNDGADDSTLGIKTLHFSLAKDAARPLNLSHEYQLVFLEDNAFSTNQFVVKTGTVLGGGGDADPDTIQVFGNVNEAEPGLVFSTPFTEGVFHNFGILLDFDADTFQIFYSIDADALEQQTDVIANNLAGQGQFHFGLLKKPTDSTGDITKDGFQELGIDEGIIFGGIFEEDSSDGCLSLSPQFGIS